MNTYGDRNESLKKMGYSTYTEYLASSLWLDIRARVYSEKGNRCTLCGSVAVVIHHVSYGKETLTGSSLSQLVPLCDSCHRDIEFIGDRKRTLVQSQTAYKRLYEKKRKSISPKKRQGLCGVCGYKLKKKWREGDPCMSCVKNSGGSVFKNGKMGRNKKQRAAAERLKTTGSFAKTDRAREKDLKNRTDQGK